MARRHLCSLVMLAVILASLAPQVRSVEPVAAVGPDGDEVVHIPLRWCVLEGTPAAEDPGALGETSTEQVLLKRMARATDAVWLDGARIVFRSAFTSPVATAARVPIIPDPVPPVAGAPDALGDIVDPQSDDTELKTAVADCQVAWDGLGREFGETFVGPIVLNIGEFVDRSGVPLVLGGWGGYTSWSPPSAHPCRTPSVLTTATGGFIAVVDLSVTGDPQVDAKLVAHELGHVLYLDHGNGLDDDNDTFYDTCDPTESATAPAPTLMHENILKATHVLTARQVGTSRDLALVYTGNQVDPPAALVNGATVSDQRTDSTRDVSTESVDLTYVELAVNEDQGWLTLTQSLFGLVEPDERNEYLAFIDLDSSEETGGSPERLGYPTHVAGADIVTEVVVEPGRNVSVTVWRFDGETFVDVTGDGVEAQLLSPEGGETPLPIFDVVSVAIPLEVAGAIDHDVSIQVIARQATDGGDSDVLPGETGDEPSGQSAELRLVPPAFPACGLTPEQVEAGDTATLEAAGFGAQAAPVSILLGDQVIATAELDESGGVSAELPIPADAEAGIRLITVGIDDTALTANCALQIGQPNS